MGVSVTGASGRSLTRIRNVAVGLGVLGAMGFYLYGPVVTPAMNSAAASECNDLIGGNYRSYRLHWVVSSRPHWVCSNQDRPAEKPVDLGWWVAPF